MVQWYAAVNMKHMQGKTKNMVGASETVSELL
jgi:hypothetical protein